MSVDFHASPGICNAILRYAIARCATSGAMLTLAVGATTTVFARTVTSQSVEPCAIPATAPRLDHAVIMVHQLDAASAQFQQLDFRVKPGRVHADSLVNRHIKFADGTGIELMALAGTPTSAMAKDYAARLADGEGGAMAALWFDDFRALQAAVSASHIPFERTRLGAWEFIAFSPHSMADALFFGRGGPTVVDSAVHVTHPNTAKQLRGVWIEASPMVDQLLQRLGATPCGSVTLPDTRIGTRWMLSAGSMVIVRPLAQARPRLIGVEVALADSAIRTRRTMELYPGFWITLM